MSRTIKRLDDTSQEDLFDSVFSSPVEDIEWEFRGHPPLPREDFRLGARRLCGSDFLTRWHRGVRSTRQIVESVARTGRFVAIPYGPSSVAPGDDPRAHELYFERLERAGRVGVKRPDLLIAPGSHREEVARIVSQVGGASELPFLEETDSRVQQLLRLSILAVECENSLWCAKEMPDYGEPLKPMRRLGGRSGLPKAAILPTVILKHEDLDRLVAWQDEQAIPIHIWQVFYDFAYGIGLDEARRLIDTGLIEATKQRFQAPGGSSSDKNIYKIYYHYAYELGRMRTEPRLVADSIEDPNGHILPYVRFEGGDLELNDGALRVVDSLRREPEDR